MSKKKKHYKQSVSGKLRNDAAQHFKQYENNVTRAAFIKNYDKFILFCREQYDCKTKKPKHLDKSKIRGEYFIRGKNKKLALEKGLPIVYDRLALMAVSIYHLSHWRLDVTVSNYMLAV